MRDRIEALLKTKNRSEVAAELGMSLSSLDRRLRKWGLTKAGWGSGKMKRKSRHVRLLYATENYTQEELAQMFGVRRETINQIINEKTYPEANFGLRGGADATVTFRYNPEGNIKSQ